MKEQMYNPRYQQGEVILLNLRSNKVRRSYASYAPVYEGVISPIEYEQSDRAVQYNSGGDVIPEEKGGILSGIGEFLFGDYHHASERFAEASLADSWRLFHEKRLLAETTNKLNLVSEAESKLNELKKAEDYADLIDNYNSLYKQYSDAVKQLDASKIKNTKSLLDQCINDIVSFQVDVKFKGKNSDINIDLFFNPDKDEKYAKPLRNKIREHVLNENLTWDKREPAGISQMLSWALNLFESGQMAIDKLIRPNLTKGNYTKKAIKQSLPEDRWTDYLFEGYDEKDGPNTTDLRNKIQPHKAYWERELESRKIDAIKSSIQYKNGNWLFDPQKINPKFREYSEHNDAGLIGGLLPDLILYSFSELGSSWSDWENMAMMTMSDVATGYGAKVLSNFAVKRSPYINALIYLDEYSRLKTAGKLAEASKLEKAAMSAKNILSQAAVSGVNSINPIGKGSAMLASTYFINRMRQHETNSEVIDAWSNRVLQNAMSNNADMSKVLNNTRTYLTDIGIPTENMTDIDLVQHALAYNIPTGDSTFETEKESARRGLDKVYNENMSLAAKDYVEALPFLSFQGSVLKSIGNGFVNRLRDKTYNSFARGILDKTIERATAKTFLGSNLSNKLASKHTADYLERALKRAGWVGAMEGIEEGQQHLLQQRYSRGEYDNYDASPSLFSLPSIVKDFQLGTDAIGAYLNILYGDPDNGTPELRRAMQIGAISGLLGGGFGLGLASNVLPSEGRDNIRNLAAQIRTDFAINKIVGDSYGTAQDTAHMNMFYDAMQKHGVTRLRLQQSLEDLKLFKGENVTDDYISRDVELLNDVWFYTNNDKFDSSMEERGIKKGSDEYKSEVINAARRRTLVREQLRHIQAKLKEQEGMKDAVLRKIFNSSDGFSEAEDPEVDRLVDQLWKSYEEYKNNRKLTRKRLELALNKVQTSEYSQDWQLKKAELDLEEFDKSEELGWHDYLDSTIDKMIAYRTLQNAEILTGNLNSSKDVIDTISKELGLGIESPKILPYLDAIQLQKDQLYKSLENDDVYDQNELRKKLNEARKKGQPILPLIENIAKRIEKKYGKLPMQDEIDSIQQDVLLSRAYYDVIKPISDMYNTGEIDPRLAAKTVSTIPWRSLSKEERKVYLDKVNEEREKEGKKPLNEKSIIFEYTKRQKDSIKEFKNLSEKYAKHLQEHKDEDDSGNTDVDAIEMRKNAARMLMDFERQKFEDLRRINHREYLRENSTVSVEEAAKNGDEDAKRVLQENIQSYSGDESSTGTSAPSDEAGTTTQQTVQTSDESLTGNTTIPTDSGRPVVESPSDESNTTSSPSDESLPFIEAPSDESGPQPINKPSDESGPQPTTTSQMTSLEKHLRELLGLEDDIPLDKHSAPSDESGPQPIEKYDEYDTRDVIEKESDESSIDELQALIEIDDHGSSRYDDFLLSRDERTVQSSDQIYSNFLHQTFKYANYAKDDELPTILTKKIIRDANGNPVVKNGEVLYEENPLKFRNGAQLRSGGQLAKKLLIPGWFEKADKYFVITADESTVLDIKNPDNLVVIMVIQDGNDAYCTFMTGLEIKINKNGGVLSNGEKEVRDRMKTMYYSSFYTQDLDGLTEHVVKDEYGNIDEDEVRLGRQIVIMSQYIAEHPGENTSKLTQEELWKKAANWYSSADQKTTNKVDLAIRRFLSGNRPVYSNEKIEEEIQSLREVRNSIIDACVSKDKWGNYLLYYDPSQYKYVKPLNPRTSGGKINDVREYGKPVFRKLTDGGFEMSNDIEVLTQQIADEEVMLGVGLGERSYAYKKGEKAPIAKLDPESTGNYNEAGYGHSGKIYYIATTVNGDRRAIQLFEKKFKDDIDKVEAEYVEESILPNGKIAEGEVPTISEFILRLITNTISDDVFEGMPTRYIPLFKKQLLKILVNADTSTWVKAKNELKQQHFAQKQFFFDDETGDLIIALPNQNGVYRHTKFNIKDIRSDENVRKIIIAAISNNLHWNTDRLMMVDMMPAEFLECLRQVFKNDDTLLEYKIAGIEDLTFKKSDLFNEDLSYKEVSLVAWMLSSGKLLTSVGDTIFDSPFVYADGAMSADPAGNIIKEIELGAEQQGPQELKTDKLKNIQERFNEFNAKRIGNLLYVQDKEAREKLTNGKKIRDFALFDIDAKIEDDDNSVTDKLKESVKSYVKFLKSEYGIDIEDKNIIYPDESEYAAVKNRQALFTAVLNRRNKVIISIDSIDSIEQMSQNDGIPVSGVFSVVRQDGTLDVDSAKKWINETLGLDNSQFIVTNGILRAMDGRIVYGVTSVVVDTLNDLVKGVIMLLKNGGRGIHYHEAFHYVNLLLHTKEERVAIYNEYMRLHPELKGSKNKVIEELLADEFMQYCMDIEAWNEKQKNRSKLSRFVHKIIKDILDFIKAWGKQDLIRKLYKSIHSGGYKGRLVDLYSINEFRKAYPLGAYGGMYIPGLKNDVKFNSIQDARTFFNVAENVAHAFLDFANIKKVSDVSGISAATFDKFLKKLERDNERTDNPYIQDVIDNYDAFIDTINSLLRRYGVVPKNKTAHGKKQIADDDTNERRQPTGEIAQLSGLYDNYTISKKDNVAFRAKLFLCLVKESHFVYDENLKQNVLRLTTDPVTGLLKYVSYDDCWQILTKELNGVDSYDEILKTVKRLSKTKAFFAEVYKNLQSISGDIELETQIFNTVNKHLTKVAQAQLQDKKLYTKKSYYSDGTEATEDYTPAASIQKTWDQNKSFEIINDNTLKAKKMLPRDWSKDLFASPLITFSNGEYRINREYAKQLQEELKEIKTVMRMTDTLTPAEKDLISQKAFPMLLSLILKMSIPFDEAVLTEYIQMHVNAEQESSSASSKFKSKYKNIGRKSTGRDDSVSSESFYDAMKQILLDPQASKTNSANISFYIDTMFNSRSSSVVKIGKKKMQAIGVEGHRSKHNLDELYEGSAGEIEMMAIAYNNIYPSSRELSITGPGGNLIFPVGENNFMSDITRWINKNHDNIIQKLQNTPYAKNSNVLEIARILTQSGRLGKTFEFKLNVFVGLEDEKSKKGVDYFGVNSLEDVVVKLIMMNRSIAGGKNKGSDMIILPTMADKKTYYALELVSKTGDDYDTFNMPHDILISEPSEEDEGEFFGHPNLNGVRRFSNTTLDRFAAYFEDEINSLELYYSKENIKAVVKNRQIRKANFHGKVKNGKMDFSGNGGHFRYFYGLEYPIEYGETIGGLNLNLILEWEYMREQQAGDPVFGDGDWRYRTDTDELDGFEGVRDRLKKIKEYFSNKDVLRNAINKMLFNRIDEQMDAFSKPGENQLIKLLSYEDMFNNPGVIETHYANRAIPTQLIDAYVQKFKAAGIDLTKEGNTINASDAYHNSVIAENLVLSVVGNFVAQSMISVIEIEKIFSGDPAFYKWKYSKKRERKVIGDRAYDFEVLLEKDTDKIKRLGALLSPGSELRTDFSDKDYERFPWLKGTKYVNATVRDVKARSIFLDETRDLFTRQMVADVLRNSKNNADLDYNNVKGENISSKGSEFAKLLTNYGNDVEVEYRGKKFRNAEHAYQTWKSGEFDEVAYKSKAAKPRGSKSANTTQVNGQSTNYWIMEEILTEKLKQHPELVKGIIERGGDAYLFNSTHNVVGDRFWESSGQNKFMLALRKAYNIVNLADNVNLKERNEIRDELLNQRINKIYTDDEAFKKEFEDLSDTLKNDITKAVAQQIKPYSNITVSDAQVLIRPHLYRKIRMMLGQWSVTPIKITYRDYKGEEHETTYSDDEAYNIIENDPNWMIDPEKAAKVSKLQLFPLKMTYFKNDPRELNPGNNIAYGLYNKMAIFPAFKFLFRSKTGRLVYERMNRAEDPLDMLTFESAVKVGLNLDIYSPYNDKTESLDNLNEGLEEDSGCVLDDSDNENWIKTGEGLTVEVLDLKGLRMQLNTEAHTDEERAIGTQMFKILFGNIYDDEDYVIDKDGRSPRKGKEIRDDIMKCIKSLTALGANHIKKMFYNEDGTTINKDAVSNYLNTVIENNNLSNTVTEILSQGGTIESLMQRTLFEHSVSSLVNSHVIDIETKGGSAVQQSVFGFVSYGANNVRSEEKYDEEGYRELNNGRELSWNEKDGSMEVMLSMNFFKSVVPKSYQRSYDEMRQWLINHDIIKGWKRVKNPILLKLNLLIDSSEYTTGPNLSVTTEAIFDELHIKRFKDIILKKAEISNRFLALGEKNLMKEVLDLLEVVGLSLDTEIPENLYVYTEESKPKPFGVGYRIPTQGLSSTFAFTVADVLPEWVGDTIIVPREFTAQTGSDFDVDKLFLATLSYKNGELEQMEGDDFSNASKGAVANRLLKNYIDVVTDVKNRANARASIDVVTDIIQDSTLPAIRGKVDRYASSMYELTPYFQLRRKQEFSIGKNGIGPFALNITNLALTQYAHVSIDFSKLPFKLGALDKVVGEDGIRISDWLSAMVNAHVDVAKDPYVFDLNVNRATYKFVNLLLRAGKGESTFLFLAQPAIKAYASAWNNSQGLYGNNLQYDDKRPERWLLMDKYIEAYANKAKGVIDSMLDEDKKKLYTEKLKDILDEKDVDWNSIFDKAKAKKALSEQNSIFSLLYQILALKTLSKLDPYAQELSDLVRVSRIDTKKFGNTIALQRNFINEYMRFKYGKRDVTWYNTDGKDIDARERYFLDTFLEDKLFTATNLTRDILSTLSIVSSKLFGDIMTTIFSQTFGATEEIKDNNGNPLPIYDKVYDEKTILEVSNAAENVIRHRLLSFYAKDINRELFKEVDKSEESPKTWNEIEKENDYTGPIDFTFGGDVEVMLKNLHRLWFGDSTSSDHYEQNSIFSNIATIISILETADYETRTTKYKDLVTEQGRIKNELLNYLKPQPANNKFAIPRMLLKKTNRNTFTDEKNRLISAFYDLLTSDIKGIRRMARDLAIYAYYSTYNTNMPNAFFDLVPIEYRKQYDMTIAEGVVKQDGASVFAVLNEDEIDYSVECSHMLDAICRNFYMNDNIVPLYEHTDKYKSKHVGGGSGEIIKNIPRSKTPMFLLTTLQYKPFLKMNVDGDVVLYKKKLRIFAETDSGNPYGKVWNLYVPISKLGVHSGTTHQYEMHASSSDTSMFEDNKIPENWDRNTVGQFVMNFINESQQRIDKELSKRKKVKTIKYVKVKYEAVNRVEIEESTSNDVHLKIDRELNNSNIITTEDPVKFIKENSNEVFDLSDDSFTTQLESLKENNQYSAEKDGINIGFIGAPSKEMHTRSEFLVTKEDIKEYVYSEIEKYTASHEGTDESSRKAYGEKLLQDKDLNDKVLYRKYIKYAKTLFTWAQINSINVDQMYFEDTPVGRAFNEEYTRFSTRYDFAEESHIVSKEDSKKSPVPEQAPVAEKPSSEERPSVIDNTSGIDDVQGNVVEGALSIDKYIDKTDNYLYDEPAPGKPVAITKEMLERLKLLKALNSVINKESEKGSAESYSDKC